MTRLTAAKEEGAFVTTPDGQKIALGIPGKQVAARESGATAYQDIPLRRAGTATEAANVILGVVSPLFSYVSGQTISVTGGRNSKSIKRESMWSEHGRANLYQFKECVGTPMKLKLNVVFIRKLVDRRRRGLRFSTV